MTKEFARVLGEGVGSGRVAAPATNAPAARRSLPAKVENYKADMSDMRRQVALAASTPDERVVELKKLYDGLAGAGAADKFLSDEAEALATRLEPKAQPKALCHGVYRNWINSLRRFGLSEGAKVEKLTAAVINAQQARIKGGTIPTPSPSAPATPAKAPAARSQSASGFSWDYDSLSKLCDSVFGRGHARAICKMPIFGITLEGQNPHNTFREPGAAARDEAKLREAVAKREASETGTVAFDKLRAEFLKFNVRVPGLSFSGLSVPHGERPTASQCKAAQARTDEFCAILGGDEMLASQNTPTARAARDMIASVQGREFTFGDKLSLE